MSSDNKAFKNSALGKAVKATLPFMALMGGGAFASSRVGSVSRQGRALVKAAVYVDKVNKSQAVSTDVAVNNETTTQANSAASKRSAFGAFTNKGNSSLRNADVKADNDVLAFLKANGLFKQQKSVLAQLSGNTLASQGDKTSVGVCNNYTSSPSCNNQPGCNWNGGSCITVAPPDITPPAFDVDPTFHGKTETEIIINVDINEGGKVYAVAVATGDTAPSAGQVFAGQDSTNGAASAANSVLLAGGDFSGTLSLTGLTKGGSYDIYVVAEDDTGTPNQSTVVKSLTGITTYNIVEEYGYQLAISYQPDLVTDYNPTKGDTVSFYSRYLVSQTGTGQVTDYSLSISRSDNGDMIPTSSGFFSSCGFAGYSE